MDKGRFQGNKFCMRAEVQGVGEVIKVRYGLNGSLASLVEKAKLHSPI